MSWWSLMKFNFSFYDYKNTGNLPTLVWSKTKKCWINKRHNRNKITFNLRSQYTTTQTLQSNIFLLKFIYSEKATQFYNTSTLRLSLCVVDKSTYVMWRFRKILWPSRNIRTLPTYFLYGKLLTHQDFLLAKTDVTYVVFLYFGQDIWLIDLSFQSKKDKRGLPEKMTEEPKFTSRAYIFPNYIYFFLFIYSIVCALSRFRIHSKFWITVNVWSFVLFEVHNRKMQI